MLKLFALFIFKILKFLNKIFFFVNRISYLEWLYFFLINDCYIEKNFKKKKIKFYSTNHLISWRVKTLLIKNQIQLSGLIILKLRMEMTLYFGILEQILGCFHYIVTYSRKK